MTPEFVSLLWAFIRVGGYRVYECKDGKKCFYRFQDPATEGFPFVLEFFSREPIEFPIAVRIVGKAETRISRSYVRRLIPIGLNITLVVSLSLAKHATLQGWCGFPLRFPKRLPYWCKGWSASALSFG